MAKDISKITPEQSFEVDLFAAIETAFCNGVPSERMRAIWDEVIDSVEREQRWEEFVRTGVGQ